MDLLKHNRSLYLCYQKINKIQNDKKSYNHVF
jgi:hypothetical protein